MAVMKWLTAIGATVALTMAMLLWGLAPASDCSTPHEIHWWTGLPFFGCYIIAGSYLAARGTAAQRLLLFITSAAIVAGYVVIISRSLPMVIQTEIGCAAEGLR